MANFTNKLTYFSASNLDLSSIKLMLQEINVDTTSVNQQLFINLDRNIDIVQNEHETTASKLESINITSEVEDIEVKDLKYTEATIDKQEMPNENVRKDKVTYVQNEQIVNENLLLPKTEINYPYLNKQLEEYLLRVDELMNNPNVNIDEAKTIIIEEISNLPKEVADKIKNVIESLDDQSFFPSSKLN